MFKKTIMFYLVFLFFCIQGSHVQSVEAGENTITDYNVESKEYINPVENDLFYYKIFGKVYQSLGGIRQVCNGSFYQQLVALRENPRKIGFLRVQKLNNDSIAANQSEEPIRVSFAGDAMFDWSVKQTVKQKGPDYPFENIKEELSSSDLSIVNLETSITTRGTQQGKQYTFRSDPIALTGLKNAGFQLVSLANNHSLDFGQAGFTDTIANLKHYQLDYIGGGLNKEEAYSARTYTLKGRTVKILAFSRVLPDYSWIATETKPGLANGYDINLIQNAIRQEKKDADFLFVFLHWGVERNRSPEPFQRQWAKLMIDSGADGVVGSHPHVLQGFEYYKDKPIAYSLGNFLFPNYIKGNAAQTGILHLDIDKGQIGMTFIPYRISQDQIVKQTDKVRLAVWHELQGLSFGKVQIQDGKISDLTMVAETDN